MSPMAAGSYFSSSFFLIVIKGLNGSGRLLEDASYRLQITVNGVLVNRTFIKTLQIEHRQNMQQFKCNGFDARLLMPLPIAGCEEFALGICDPQRGRPPAS